jgi:hypothetical protein
MGEETAGFLAFRIGEGEGYGAECGGEVDYGGVAVAVLVRYCFGNAELAFSLLVVRFNRLDFRVASGKSFNLKVKKANSKITWKGTNCHPGRSHPTMRKGCLLGRWFRDPRDGSCPLTF